MDSDFDDSMLDPITIIRRPGYASQGHACPKEPKVWLEVAAGIVEERSQNELMIHASQCDFCGPRLRLALHDFNDPPTAKEQAQMAGVRDYSPTSRRRPRIAGITKWFSIAAAIVFAIGLAGWWFNRPSVEVLLARAYSENRQFDWRLPDAGWTEAHVERGRDEPAKALVEAELLLGSDSSAQFELQARADLLDSRYDLAVEMIDRALASKPNSMSALRTAAVIHAVQSDRARTAEGYAAAVDYASRVLKIDSHDGMALFNRALANERLSRFELAIADWKAFLAVEQDPAWRMEGTKRLDKIENMPRPSLIR